MAISKLINIGEAKDYPSSGLAACLHYISNPKKTEHNLLLGSNCGNTWREVYFRMMKTKEKFGKLDKRQGYHLVISFVPGETDKVTAYKIIQEFCEKYLGDNYEYLFSVHTDTNHLHGHICFNSVSRETGKKFHYKKGDWEKNILPITNELCRKYHLSELRFDENEKRNEYNHLEYWEKKKNKLSMKDFIRADIDDCINRSDNYTQFLELLKEKYQIRLGESNGEEYITIQWGNKKGERRRIYSDYSNRKNKNPFGWGYSLNEIKERIIKKDKVNLYRPYSNHSPMIRGVRSSKRMFRNTTYIGSFQKRYLLCYMRLENIHYLNRIQGQKKRRAVLRSNKILKNLSYLIQKEIRSERQLEEQVDHLDYLENDFMRKKRTLENSLDENDRKVLEIMNVGYSEFSSEEDYMEYIEDHYPVESLQKIDEEIKTLKETIYQIRKEKRIAKDTLQSLAELNTLSIQIKETQNRKEVKKYESKYPMSGPRISEGKRT